MLPRSVSYPMMWARCDSPVWLPPAPQAMLVLAAQPPQFQSIAPKRTPVRQVRHATRGAAQFDKNRHANSNPTALAETTRTQPVAATRPCSFFSSLTLPWGSAQTGSITVDDVKFYK